MFNSFPSFLLSLHFGFTISARVSWDGNLIDNGEYDDPGLNYFYEDIPFLGVLGLFFFIYSKNFN